MNTKGTKVERHQVSDMDKIGDVLASEADRMEKEVDIERRYVRTAAPRNPSQVYSIRIPVELLGRLRQLATFSQVPTTAMLRRWILERLAIETVTAERKAAEAATSAHGVQIAMSEKTDGTDASALRKELRRAIGMRPAA